MEVLRFKTSGKYLVGGLWSRQENSRHFTSGLLKGTVGNIHKRAQFAGKSASAAIMPPKKKAANEPNKKTEQKKKEKIIEVTGTSLCSQTTSGISCLLMFALLHFKGQNVRFEKQEGQKATDFCETSDPTGSEIER